MRRAQIVALAILLFAPLAVAQIINTIAGGGPNNLPATSANLNGARGVVFDSAGNLYVAVQGGNRVYKVTPAGQLTIFAGNGTGSFSGDGGLAVNAGLSVPIGIALDSSGNLFIADLSNHRIRRVDAVTGNISTVAGNGVACTTPTGLCGDGGLATSARLNSPSDVAMDAVGNLFIADQGTHRIRRVDAITGNISSVAGNGIACSPSTSACGDGGPATSANLNNPFGVAFDSAGNLHIADLFSQRIRRVDAVTGIITSVVGNGTPCSSATLPCGDGGLATNANLRSPTDVAFDPSGNLLVVDFGDNRIRRVNASTQVITTIAGTGTGGFNGDNIPATSATLNNPSFVALDSAGNLFIGDWVNNRVRRVDHLTGIITTFAGNGSTTFSGDNFSATSVSLSNPFGVVLDGSANLYISDFNNNRIRRVDAGGITTTVAGNGSASFCGDGGAATSACLRSPLGLALDGSGNLYLVDSGNNRVRKVNAAGIITTVAGNGSASFGGDGAIATSASLNSPVGAAVDGAGNLFIADQSNQRIRRVDAVTKIISTVAGSGASGFCGDGGTAMSACLFFPQGIGFDATGNLYIADFSNQRVRKVTPGADGVITGAADEIITTVAGNGSASFCGDGGLATSACLRGPLGVASDGAGNLFIVDRDNQRTRRVDTGGIITTVAGNGTFGFRGDGGPATSAQLANPRGVALDGAGNVYVADFSNNRIRRVDNAANHAPVANAGPSQTLVVASTTGANVTLDGSGSTDADGDPLTYTWTGPFTGGTASGQIVSVFAPMGTSTMTLTVQDGKGGVSSATTRVTITNTAVAITITTNPAVYSQNLSYNIKVSSPLGGTPTGTVTSGFAGFSPNTFNLINGQVNFGQAAFTAIGSTLFTATYNGDSTFAVSSAATNLVVNMASTTVTLTSSTNPSLPGQAVTFTATVNPVAPSSLFCWGSSSQGLTGTVQFVVDGVNSGSPIALSSLCSSFRNKGTVSISTLTAGTHTIAAVYSGNSNYNGSTSSLTQTVTNPVPTFNNLSSPAISFSASPTSIGGNISGSSGVPTGTVTISVNSVSQTATVLADGSFSANFATAAFGVAGSPYSISFSYSGDSTYNPLTGSGTLTISKASQTITFDAIPSHTYGDAPFALNASASSGLAVSYAASGNCSVAGATLTITGAGSCTVTASQGGDSNWNAATNVSNTFSIAKANQTISFAVLANKSYGDAAFAVSATASSGLAVSFSSIGNCTNAGAMVTIAGAGSCTVTASQGGDSNWNPAPDVPQSFSIAKAAAAVSVTGGTFTYDGNAHPATGSVTGVFGESLGMPIFTYNGSASAPVNAGIYAVVGSFAGDSNYDPATGTANITINKADQKIAYGAALADKIFGDVPFAVSATSSSGLAVSFSAAGNCTVTGNIVTITGAGTCTITASQIGDGNFNPAPDAPQSFNIAKATAAVTLGNLSQIYDGTGKSASATSNPANLVVSFTYNGSAALPVNAGSYAVAATVNDPNYQGSSSGTLTVALAPLTITADNAVRVFGVSNPVFTASYSGFVNGENPTVLSGVLTCATPATSLSPAASYPIICSGQSSTNYNIAYVNGTLTIVPAPTTVGLTSDNNPSLYGVPLKFTATVSSPAAPSALIGGTVSFMEGTTTLAVQPVSGGVGSFTTSTLSVGSHSITAVFNGDPNFLPSAPASLTETISPSATLNVAFVLHNVLDDSHYPKVSATPVAGAEVHVFAKKDPCTNGLIVSGQPKLWGKIFDGLDGPGGTDPGCPIVSFGNYQAQGVTDANGMVSIIVPPATEFPDIDYVVIGRTLNSSLSPTPPNPVALYSGKTLDVVAAGTQKNVKLRQLRLFSGKMLPAKDMEEHGSFLAIVEPEYMDWTNPQEHYPFVLEAEGDWTVTTSVAPPAGFVPDTPQLSTNVVNNVDALQFTVTDVGSSWTHMATTYVIEHKGETRMRVSKVPMFNHQPGASDASEGGHAVAQEEKPLEPLHFVGFLKPLDNTPETNRAQAGSSVSLQWQLFDSKGGYMTDLKTFASLRSAAVACDASPASVAEKDFAPNGGVGLHYDESQHHFVIKWKTERVWSGCRIVELKLTDGTSHFAKFNFDAEQ